MQDLAKAWSALKWTNVPETEVRTSLNMLVNGGNAAHSGGKYQYAPVMK